MSGFLAKSRMATLIPRTISHWASILGTIVAGVSVGLLTSPVWAADHVTLSFGLIDLSVPVSSLEAYVDDNHIDQELAFYIGSLSESEQAELREFLATPLDLSSVAVSQALYSPLGEFWLQRLGEVIQTGARQNGFFALRSALILSASDDGGVSLINVIRRFPTSILRIDSIEVLDFVGGLVNLVERTEAAIAALDQQSVAERDATPTPDFEQFPDLTQPGPLSWQTATWQLNDTQRNRTLGVDLYTPETETPAPLIVISHGFSASRAEFVYMAQHLASHGFAVVALDHPGSNRQQVENLFAGNASAAIGTNEFMDRPKDVSYLLDHLESKNQTDPAWQNRFDFTQVGMIGHSFGGYTAIALAGAPLNIGQLQTQCETEPVGLDAVNVSISLQCLALQSEVDQPLTDDRIKAIFVFNPITSLLFGQTGLAQLDIPIFMIGGSSDVIAPALPEQIQPFTWLTTPNRYLALIEGGSHNYQQSDFLPTELSGADPALAREYLKALGLAFMQTHVTGQSDYAQFLQSSYAHALGRESLPLTIVRSLSPQILN